MRFVTINLDTDDASVIHETIVNALERCNCETPLTDERCSSCLALSSVAADIDRMLRQPAQPSGRMLGARAFSQRSAGWDELAGSSRSPAAAPAARLRLLPRRSDANGSRSR